MEQIFTKQGKELALNFQHVPPGLWPQSKKIVLILFFCLAFVFNALAQTTVTGTVTDTAGEPLPGVSVKLKGSSVGASTNSEGRYLISIPNTTGTLVFSFIGLLAQEIPVSGRTQINVALKDDVSKLDEVVVTGYGTQARETLTTSISKLDTRTLENVPYSNVLSALQGSLPGLRVQSNSGQPGSAPRVTLRGGTSINNARGNSANNPLYLVDGVIRENLNDIPTEEIESLQVLKDAAATSIYGARASNGVVLVTTKSAKAGVTRINYSYDITTSEVPNTLEYASAADYITYSRLGSFYSLDKVAVGTVNARLTIASGFGTGNDLTKNTGFTTQFLNAGNQHKLNEGWKSLTDPIKTNALGQWDPVNGTNKQIIYQETDFNKLTFKTGLTQNHYLSASGGTEKAKFNAGLGYLKNEGTSLNSYYNRLSANVNGSLQISNNLRVNGRVLFSNADVDGPGVNQNGINQETNGQFGVLAETFYRSTGLPSTAKFKFEDGTMAPGQSNSLGNPLYYQTGPFAPVVKNVVRKTTVSLGAKWDILPGLSFEPLISYFDDNTNGRYFQPGRLIGAAGSQTSRIARHYDYNTSSLQADGVLSYVKSLSDHNLGVKTGFTYYNRKRTNFFAEGQGAGTDLIPTLAGSATFNSATATEGELSTEGVFGRVNYDYAQKYLLELTGRYDGASNLGANNRFAFFPGVGLGWNIHKENFWKVMPEQISSVKLRASYGENGNIQGLSDFEWQGTFDARFTYNSQAGIITGALPNPALKWEKSRTLDAGLDLGFFAGRVGLVMDYYERITNDLLTAVNLPTSSGYSSVRTNNGSLRNRGIEGDLKLNVLPVNSAFQWSANFNASKVNTEVLKLPFNNQPNNRQSTFEVWDPKAGAYVHVAGYQNGNAFGNPASFMEGARVGDMYAYKQTGVYSTDADAAKAPLFDAGATTDPGSNPATQKKYAGDAIFDDIDNNGRLDSRDQVYVGNSFPTWTGGFSNYLTYKGFNLAIRTDFTTGHTIYNYAKATADGQLQGDILPTKDYLEKSWKKQGDITNTPRYTFQLNGNIARSSAYYEKGDFIALREITVGYTLPASLVRKVKLKGMRINLSGSNLHYFTNYTGSSPEEGGSDGGRYPNPRTFILGTNITL